MGVVGVYLAKIFQEVKARPSYVVRSLRGLAPARGAPGPERPAS
jgi:hypothetical protein